MPQSLLYYIFSFGTITEEDEKKYIGSIIECLFKNNNQTQPNEINLKLRSIICSIYLCYYIRLTDEVKRSGFEIRIRKLLLDLVNHINNETETTNKDESDSKPKEGDLIEEIKNEEFKTDIKSRPTENIR